MSGQKKNEEEYEFTDKDLEDAGVDSLFEELLGEEDLDSDETDKSDNQN